MQEDGRTGSSPTPAPADEAGRLEAIERALVESSGLIRQLVEAVGGMAVNQQELAGNQSRIIAALSRLAERLPPEDRH